MQQPQETRVSQDDGLEAWIGELRDRLERGGLPGLGAVDVGYGTARLPTELTVRIMLADLDHCEEPPICPARRARDIGRGAALREDLRRLRALIDRPRV